MSRNKYPSKLTRRHMIRGAAAITASAMLPGCSSSSLSAISTPASQTISFPAFTSPVPFNAKTLTLTAIASSGLPVTFGLISGSAILNGNTLTFTGIGTVLVEAQQNGNASFNAAPAIVQSISVSNPNPQPVPTSITPASLAVAATKTGTVNSGFAGLSYEKYHLNLQTFSSSNTNLVALFKMLGPSVLRIGGAATDEEVWAPSGAGMTAGQIAPSDVNALASFLKATGWQCLYAINLGGDTATGTQGPNGTGSPTYPTTPQLAAQEVAYVVNALGSSLLGIEIGNEPDNYYGTYFNGDTGWTSNVANTEATFQTLWGKYRTAILATTPNAPLTGPATAAISRISNWTTPFGQSVTSSQITQLTQHYYRAQAGASGATAANLITADATLITGLSTLQTGAQSIGIPYRISECNNFSNGGQLGVSNTYASTLWVMDFLYNCVQGGAVGVNLHGGGDAPAGYTPIADNNGVVNGIRPEFYGLLMFVLAGQGTLYKTTVAASSLNVTAYAVLTATGGINLIINNKDSTNNLQMNVQLPQIFNIASILELTQTTAGSTSPSLAATSGVTIQGASVGINASFTPGTPYYAPSSAGQVTVYVPALSAVLVQLS